MKYVIKYDEACLPVRFSPGLLIINGNSLVKSQDFCRERERERERRRRIYKCTHTRI
jgi:hypothetical protein